MSNNVAYVNVGAIAFQGASSSNIVVDWTAVAVDQSTGMSIQDPVSGDYRAANGSIISLTAGDVISGEVVRDTVAVDVRTQYGDPGLVIVFLP